MGCVYIYIWRDGGKEGLFQGAVTCDYGGWGLQILQSGQAGWRPREEPVLQFESEGCLLAEFLIWGRSFFVLFVLPLIG